MRNRTYHVAGAWQNPITSRRRWQRDQTPLPNTKANQNQRTQQISKPNILIQRTKNKGVYQKKKKKSPIHKPSNPRSPSSSPQRGPRRRLRNGGPHRIDIVDW